MALITCLYCGEKIYEHVSVCPKCNNSEPFDATVKAKKEAKNKPDSVTLHTENCSK